MLFIIAVPTASPARPLNLVEMISLFFAEAMLPMATESKLLTYAVCLLVDLAGEDISMDSLTLLELVLEGELA
jgi:hypothetical protein